jgi:hypothetical protein
MGGDTSLSVFYSRNISEILMLENISREMCTATSHELQVIVSFLQYITQLICLTCFHFYKKDTGTGININKTEIKAFN